MKKKIALIFGITGQDGAYLSKYLLKKKYIVHGVVRRASLINTQRIDNIYEDPSIKSRRFILHYGDIIDSSSVSSIINLIMPDEIYNLAAQSHVNVSFQVPEYTGNVDGLGTLRILEVVKSLRKKKKKLNSTKQEHLKCLVEHKKNHKMKKQTLNQKAHMLQQNFMHIGLLKFIEKHTEFLLQMEYFLIMKVH